MSRIRSCLTLEASKQVYTSPLQPLFDYADVARGLGANLRGVLQRVTPPTEPCISNYITEEYLKCCLLYTSDAADE